MGVPLPDVEIAVLVRSVDEVDEKLLSVGIDVTVLEVAEMVTEGLPLSNVNEPLGELVPPVDEDTPPCDLLGISVDEATDVKVLCWEPIV